MKTQMFAVISAKDWLPVKLIMFIPIAILLIVPVGAMHSDVMHYTFGFVIPAFMLIIAISVFQKSATLSTKVILGFSFVAYSGILGANVYHHLV